MCHSKSVEVSQFIALNAIPCCYSFKYITLFFSSQGIEYLYLLQNLNLYYNHISSLLEVSRLQTLPVLTELDLRLNPVTRKESDYRLYTVYMLQTLEKLGESFEC